MKTYNLKTVALALACLAALMASSIGAAQAGYAKRIDLHLKDADLHSATFAVTVKTGIAFVIAESSEPFGLITLSIPDVTPEDAIRYICDAAGAWAERDQNGVYIIRRGRPEAAVPEIALNLPVDEPERVQKIILMRGDPVRIYNILLGRGGVFNAEDSVLAINRAAAAKIVAGGRIPRAPLIMVTGGTQQTVYPTSTTQGVAIPNEIVLPDESVGQVGFGGGGGLGGGGQGGLGGGGQGGFGGGGQGGQGGFGGGTASSLTAGQGLVPQGISQFVYDPTDNSLIVKGTDQAIRELELLIAQFDVAPKQVIIKVEFITTSTSLDTSLGIDWFYQRGSMFAGSRPGTFARSSDPIFINYATGNISTRLRTLLTHGWGRTVTAPLIRTLNNQLATISNTVTTTIFVNTVTSGPGGIVITPNPFPLTAFTFLAVTPRINNDGTVTVGISPTLSAFGQFKRGPDGQEIPDTLQQSISVVARVKSGETIALGGMTNKVDNYSESRIPILSDLPIIGQLFKGRNTNTLSSELIIFVTPTIVEDDEYGLGP